MAAGVEELNPTTGKEEIDEKQDQKERKSLL